MIRAKSIQYFLIAFGVTLHLCLIYQSSYSAVFSPKSEYRTCFSPGNECTNQIAALIDQAKHSIKMATYSFTSWPIARALLRANRRGVAITIVCDRSLFKDRSVIQALMKRNIPVWVDESVNIAHNKYCVIDERIVETGSFNYTVSANRYNAENVLIIDDPKLARVYLDNFKHRITLSTPGERYHYHPKLYHHTKRRH